MIEDQGELMEGKSIHGKKILIELTKVSSGVYEIFIEFDEIDSTNSPSSHGFLYPNAVKENNDFSEEQLVALINNTDAFFRDINGFDKLYKDFEELTLDEVAIVRTFCYTFQYSKEFQC